MRFGNVLAVAGVLGAGLWIARWGLGDGSAGDALLWAGAALLTVLAVGVGTLMVRPIPLKAVVGPCLGLLAWSLAAVAAVDDEPVVGGVIGLVLLVVVPVTWERTRPLQRKAAARSAEAKAEKAGRAKPQRAGSHAR